MSDTREFCHATGKEMLATPQAAAQAARNTSRMGKPTTSYRCEHCDQWHFGRGKPAKVVRVRKLHGKLELSRTARKFGLKDVR